MKLRDIKAL